MDSSNIHKTPLDVRLVAWVVAIPSGFFTILSILLISGISKIAEDDPRPTLFGLLWVSTRLGMGLHLGITGTVGLFCAHRVWHCTAWGWWILLALIANTIVSDLQMLPRFWVSISIIGVIRLGIVGWMVYRRKLFGIRF